MSYLTFLLVFVLPAIAAGVALRQRPVAGVGVPRARWAIPLTSLIAFVYTTPWDNYIVREGVWAYGADRVIGVLGYVPLEEYAFFVLQPILAGVWLYRALERRPFDGGAASERVRWVGVALLTLVTLAGVGLLVGPRSGFYLGMILAGFGPVLAGLWAYGGPHFAVLADRWLPVVAIVGTYLNVCDRIAIGDGIWHITEATSTGAMLAGLPVEEAVFFYVTSLLSVWSVLLFLHGDRIRPFWRR